jgi:hypothetical protein
MNIRYFFIADRAKNGELRIEYCPTEKMIGDFFTKPLQGAQFYILRDDIMNVDPRSVDPINGDTNGAFQVYYQNVHGIHRDNVSLSQDLQAFAEYDVGCFCLSETNLDWHHPYVQ